MRTKFINFMNSFVEKFDTPKNSELAKRSSFKFLLKKPDLSQVFQQVRAENLS